MKSFTLKACAAFHCQKYWKILSKIFAINHRSHVGPLTHVTHANSHRTFNCILYLHKSYNIPPPPPPAPEICTSIVLNFSLDISMLQEKLQTDYAKFWGVKEVYYGICASRELWNTISSARVCFKSLSIFFLLAAVVILHKRLIHYHFSSFMSPFRSHVGCQNLP